MSADNTLFYDIFTLEEKINLFIKLHDKICKKNVTQTSILLKGLNKEQFIGNLDQDIVFNYFSKLKRGLILPKKFIRSNNINKYVNLSLIIGYKFFFIFYGITQDFFEK